jgi:hypothetical protein
MATTRDDVMIALGLDYTRLTAGQLEVEQQTKKASMNYVAFWNEAFKAKDAAEIKSNAESLARLKAFQDAKLNMEREFFAEQAAQADIAAGSIPQNMVRTGERGLESAGEGALFGGAAAAVSYRGGGTQAVNEGRALLDEAARGSYRRMISSFLRFLGLLGVELIPLLAGIAVGAVIDLIPFLKMRAAQAAADVAAKDLKGREKATGEMLRGKIGALERGGQISKEDADFMRQQIESGDIDSVLNQVNKISGGQTIDQLTAYANARQQAIESQKREQGELNNLNKPAGTAQDANVQRVQDMLDKEGKIDFLKKSIAAYENISHRTAEQELELQQEKARLLQYEIDVKKDRNEIDKENADLVNKQKDAQKEYNKEIDELHQRLQDEQLRVDQAITARGSEYPTLQQLARFSGHQVRSWGHRFFQRTDEGETAHEILWLQRDQLRARLSGNIAGADFDASRITYLKDALAQAGYISPDNKLENMENHLGEIRNSIQQLNAAAQNAGIAIKTGE